MHIGRCLSLNPNNFRERKVQCCFWRSCVTSNLTWIYATHSMPEKGIESCSSNRFMDMETWRRYRAHIVKMFAQSKRNSNCFRGKWTRRHTSSDNQMTLKVSIHKSQRCLIGNKKTLKENARNMGEWGNKAKEAIRSTCKLKVSLASRCDSFNCWVLLSFYFF